MFDSHCCQRINNSSNKPSKVKNKVWFDEKCRYLHTYYINYNVLQAYTKDRNTYNRELLIKARKEYKVCVVKTRRRYKKHEGNRLDNLSDITPGSAIGYLNVGSVLGAS